MHLIPKHLLPILLLTLLCFPAGRCESATQTVTLPITIDYPLLRSLLVTHAFPEPNESVTLVDKGNGCVYLQLSSPQVREQDGTLRVEVQVAAHTGMPLNGTCYTPKAWQGVLVLHQKPRLNPADWSLSFETEHLELLKSDRQPAKMVGVLWKVMKPYINAYLAQIAIDLMPPVNDLKHFLLPLFPADRENQVQAMLNSMRPGTVEIEPHALYLPILADVSDVYDHELHRQQVEMDEKALEQTITLWEHWDGLLVYLITSLSGNILDQEEKQLLINVLLDTRHRFVTELEDKSIQHDIVRQQFIQTWGQLAPLFRKHLLDRGDTSQSLGYLGFFSSADALMVLDRLGPTFGIEISTAGLIRLVEMLNGNPDLLQYREAPNPKLQQLFKIAPLDENHSNSIKQSSPVPLIEGGETSGIINRIIHFFLPQPAYAGSGQKTLKHILQWKVPKTHVGEYISRVEKLIKASTVATLIKGKIPDNRQAMFRQLIPAMAWQESCFRQFVIKNKKIVYLRSYNMSSVGLMQINERVWRGLYDLNRLRWDIHYNAAAGCDIAALYLQRYALNKDYLDDDTMARLIYAMYNGGPSQRTKFLDRHKAKKYYDSDRLFWEKYQMVSAGEVKKVSICLVGH